MSVLTQMVTSVATKIAKSTNATMIQFPQFVVSLLFSGNNWSDKGRFHRFDFFAVVIYAKVYFTTRGSKFRFGHLYNNNALKNVTSRDQKLPLTALLQQGRSR